MRRGALIAAIAALALALALALGATAGPAAAGTGIVHPSGPDPVLREWPNWPYPVTCGNNVFDPSTAFDGPTEAEAGSGAPELALRRYLAEGLYAQTPQHYWRLAALSPTRADFASGLLSLGPFFLSFELEAGEWSVLGEPQTCTPRSLREGRKALGWRLAPGQGIGPRTRGVRVDLSGGHCHGKTPLSELVEPPQFAGAGRRLAMTIWLAPRTHPGTCPRARETPLLVKLPGKLGTRQLFDGSTYPPLARSSRLRQ
jgi:hypothetical protein